MKRLQLNKVAFVTALAMTGIAPALALAANERAFDAVPAKVATTYEGSYLVTPAGMALYLQASCTDAPETANGDQQSGMGEYPNIGYKLIKSCLDKFRPYVAEADARPVGDFSIVPGPKGVRQWAYKDFPLYFSNKDHAPGDHYGVLGRRAAAGPSVDPLLPAGFAFVRQEDGLIITTTENRRAVFTPSRNARLRPASVGGPEFKPISAPQIANLTGDWSAIAPAPGFKQFAFKGKPLYRAPAGVSDDDVLKSGDWELVFVQKAPAVPLDIGKRLTLAGDVYTDKKGMTLYTYSCIAGGVSGAPRPTSVPCDDTGDPAAFMVALCGDGKECARRWRPYIAAAGAKGEGEFSIVDITYPMFTDMRGTLYPSDAPKVKAWAYRGKPLFTYYEDEKPGDLWGNATGGIWGSNFTALLVPGRSAISFEP